MVPPPPKACASCRYRKIKCDRRDKLQEANAADDSDVKCSNCEATSTSCTFISAPPKQRQGKRIRALRNFEQDELLYGQASSSSSSSNNNINHNNQLASRSSNNVGQFQLRSNSQFDSDSSNPSTSAFPLEAWRPTSTTSNTGRMMEPASSSTLDSNSNSNNLRPGMFGIRGLSRQLLEACVAAYLFNIAPTLPIIRPDYFVPRLRAFFKLYSGELPESGVEPLDDLLVIASACAGSACLNSQSQAEESEETVVGSERKFQILSDLKNAFHSLAESENGERLKRARLDGIEACYIMAVIKEDEFSNELNSFSRNHNPELRISPASTEGVVRIATAMGLNSRSSEKSEQKMKMKTGINGKVCARSGSTNEEEGGRRNRIWWCILGNDAFRAMAHRRPAFIAEDSFDHGGDSVMADHLSDLQGLPIWIMFEFQWLSAMVTISFLARSIIPRILSERAQKRGIAIEEATKVIESLEKWRDELPKEVSWESQHQSGIHGSGNGIQERRFKCRLRALYVECLYHFSVIALYYGLEDAGFRNLHEKNQENRYYLPDVVSDPISLNSIRSCSSSSSASTNNLNSINFTSTPTSSSSNSSNPDSIFSQTLRRVENLTSKTFDRLAIILPQAASEGMIRASASVLRGAGTQAILWASETVVRQAKEGSTSSENLFKTLTQAEALISAVATCDSSQENPVIVRQMRETVARAGNEVQQILNNQKNRFSSTSSAGSVSNDFPQEENVDTSMFSFSPSNGNLGDASAAQFQSNTSFFSQFDSTQASNPTPTPSSNPNSNSCSTPNSNPNPNIPTSSADPSSLLSTTDLGTDSSDQVPEWLANFVTASGRFPSPAQDPTFDFSLPDQQWSNNLSEQNSNLHPPRFN